MIQRISSRLVALFSLAFMLLNVAACTKPATIEREETKTQTADPWPKAVTQIERDNSADSIQQAFSTLNQNLQEEGNRKQQPSGLDPEQQEQYRTLMNLSAVEMERIEGQSYIELDAYYVAQCYYLRDIANGIIGSDDETRAIAALAWIDRQIVSKSEPTIVVDPQTNQAFPVPPLPPSYTLRLGTASSMERGFLYLELLRQMGLSGCLLGVPEIVETTPMMRPLTEDNPTSPEPFWGVGVLVEDSILLFDMARNLPVPAADGIGIARLKELHADSTQFKDWLKNDPRAKPLTVEQLQQTKIYLTLPLPTVAPRMKRLNEALGQGIRLAADPVTWKERFATATEQTDISYWNPTNEGYTGVKLLASFLPKGNGGFAPNDQRRELYEQELLPRGLLALPRSLYPDPNDPSDLGALTAASFLAEQVEKRYRELFLGRPTAREQLQRGQSSTVTANLVKERADLERTLNNLQGNRTLDQKIEQWVQDVRTVDNQVFRARDEKDTVRISEAQEELAKFYKDTSGMLSLILDRALTGPALAETTYLLALSRHEQAEREVARNSPTAYDALREAANWWRLYSNVAEYQAPFFPGRKEQAQRLSKRIETLTQEVR